MTDNSITENKAKAQVFGNIATALASAQAKMGKALKSANNPHFKSKYADLASVTEACLPALNESGIAVIQPTGEDETGRYVETMLIHGPSGEVLKCRVPLIVQKNDMQGYGSAVTYARRYGLMSMSGIAPEDDDGNDAAKAPPKAQQAPKGPSDQAVSEAKDMLFGADDMDDLIRIWKNIPKELQHVQPVIDAKDDAKLKFQSDRAE
jgi:hypothetical protein